MCQSYYPRAHISSVVPRCHRTNLKRHEITYKKFRQYLRFSMSAQTINSENSDEEDSQIQNRQRKYKLERALGRAHTFEYHKIGH